MHLRIVGLASALWAVSPLYAKPVDVIPACSVNPAISITPYANLLFISSNGGFVWNHGPIEPRKLYEYLQETRKMVPEPDLHISFAPTTPSRVVNMALRFVLKSGVTKACLQPGAHERKIAFTPPA